MKFIPSEISDEEYGILYAEWMNFTQTDDLWRRKLYPFNVARIVMSNQEIITPHHTFYKDYPFNHHIHPLDNDKIVIRKDELIFVMSIDLAKTLFRSYAG